MDGDRIWERQENESVRDYEYFRIYLLSPPARANPFPPLLPVCGTVIFVPFAPASPASAEARSAMDGAAPTTKPVGVVMRFWRKYATTSRRYGDLDNLMKAVLDGLNGTAFADDSQVISATLEKLQAPEPRLEIEIYELTPSTTTPLEMATR